MSLSAFNKLFTPRIFVKTVWSKWTEDVGNGGKFTAGVTAIYVDLGKTDGVPTIPAVNFPPVSTTPMVKLPPAVHLETHIYSRILTLWHIFGEQLYSKHNFHRRVRNYNLRVITGVVVNCKLIISKQKLIANELSQNDFFSFYLDKQVKINISQFII